MLSLRRAGLERKWRAMQEQFEAGVIIEAPVIDHNKGGLIVDCGIRGFVPISQIVDFPRRPQNDQPRDAAQEIAEKLQPFVGRRLRLKILEANVRDGALHLSVENPVDEGVATRPGEGVGLQNVRQRLDALSARDARLDTRREGGTFRVTLRLPARRPAPPAATAPVPQLGPDRVGAAKPPATIEPPLHPGGASDA